LLGYYPSEEELKGIATKAYLITKKTGYICFIENHWAAGRSEDIDERQ